MSWTQIDQENLNAASMLWSANQLRYGSEQFENEHRSRPSTLYSPKIYLDGNEWCALLGDNIQCGVCGFGDSPNEAYLDFDKKWFEKVK